MSTSFRNWRVWVRFPRGRLTFGTLFLAVRLLVASGGSYPLSRPFDSGRRHCGHGDATLLLVRRPPALGGWFAVTPLTTGQARL